MPKLKNVTEAELDQLNAEIIDLQHTAADYESRLQQGYCDQLLKPDRLGRDFLSASRRLADLASALLYKADAQELSKQVASLREKQEKRG